MITTTMTTTIKNNNKNNNNNLGQTTRTSGSSQQKKRTCRKMDFFAPPAEDRVKFKESEKRVKSLDLARKLKKNTEHEADDGTNCNRYTWKNYQKIEKWTRRFGNKRTRGDHPDYSIIKIGQNTEKSPGDLKRLAVT